MLKHALTFIQTIIATSLLLCSSLYADPSQTLNDESNPTYKVEVIIFSHITEATLKSEQWPLVNSQDVLNDLAFNLRPDAVNDYLKTTHYQLLPSTDYSLNQLAAKLNRKHNYTVLLHQAWEQQVLSPKESQPIHIFGGDQLSKITEVIVDPKDPNYYNSQDNWSIDGEINISLNRYFNINLNLLFAIPTDQLPSSFNHTNTPVKSSMTYFHLLQNRRMRSKEINYIDYPLFGVIIKITPIQPKDIIHTAPLTNPSS